MRVYVLRQFLPPLCLQHERTAPAHHTRPSGAPLAGQCHQDFALIPEGCFENSPAFQGWVSRFHDCTSPAGTAECVCMSYVSSYHHCVFSTKERRPLITAGLQERLWPSASVPRPMPQDFALIPEG